jgi:hypothetical protein
MRRISLGFALLALALFGFVSSASANHSINELLSIGPDGGNGSANASFSGASVGAISTFFRTDESLVLSDTDGAFDIYKRRGNTTTLESVGSQTGVGLDANFVANYGDGSQLLFSTRDQLVSQDTDAGLDVYLRSGGTTTLFPTTAAASAATSAVDYQINGWPSDGSRIFFTTSQQLIAQDTDSVQDVYQVSGGTVTLLSVGPNGGNGPIASFFDGVSADGSHVFFHTDESLLVADMDSQPDIYDRSGGVTTKVSVGPAGGNGAFPATFGGASSDGSHVYFTTGESLIGFPDTDGGYVDVYDRFGGNTALLSYGPNSFDGPYNASFGGATSDGAKVFFNTNEPLISSDTDGGIDVYSRSASGVQRVSNPGGLNEVFALASSDGSQVAWYDGNYCCSGQHYINMSYSGNAYSVDCCFGTIRGVSGDGRVIFTGGDGRTYEYHLNGPLDQLLGPGEDFQYLSPDFHRLIFHTTSQRVAADTDSAQDVYSLSEAGAPPASTAYPRPKGASPLRLSLVPIFKQCTGPNSSHPAPLSFPSCTPPELASDYVTIGDPQANGQGANFIGVVNFIARLGTPAPEDDADNLIGVSMTDIRNKSNLADYAGEMRAQMTLRLTDKTNGTSGTDGATVQDLPFSFNVPCSPTPTDGTIGSKCSLSTTADTLLPGMVPEGKRSVTHIGDLKIYDGGSDGDGDTTGDNTPFAWEGIFTP